jgi:hypothetical protein
LLPECHVPVTNPAACEAALANKRAQEAAAKAGRFGQNLIGPIISAASFIPGIGTAVGISSKVVTTLEEQPPQEPLLKPRGSIMSFVDGINSGDAFSFDNLLGGINQALQGGLGQTLLNIGGQAATGFINQQFAVPTSLAAVPGGAVSVARTAGAVATVGRGFFNKFPNLATAIQGYRNMGKNVSRSKLYSLMKRFGPDFLVAGGILTATAVSELAMAGPGRRRMNAGNVKALRRAHRRMKSFHHICQNNDILLHRGRRAPSRGRVGGGTSVVSVK